MSKLIAIEGLDGSGKGTQSAHLLEAAKRSGLSAAPIDFPNYGSRGAEPVKMYLEGALGNSPGDTGAYAASVFFATDRYISYKTEWEASYKECDLIIANRYTTANAYHQMAKLPRESWDSFLGWLWDLEFSKMGLPAPDGVIMLSLPTEVSARLIEERCKKTGVTKDIHECDRVYLEACRTAAVYAAEKLDWALIDCSDGCGGIRSIEDIHKEICLTVYERFSIEITPVL